VGGGGGESKWEKGEVEAVRKKLTVNDNFIKVDIIKHANI
jgi:hypothetical protein